MSTEPRLPEVGEYVRGKGRLVEVQDVTKPVVPEFDYVFEQQEARIEWRVNGKQIKDGATFNDFYGEGTCVTHAIEQAKSIVHNLGECDVEIVVVKVVSQIRMRPNGRENFYAKEFRDFKYLESGCAWNLPEPVEEVVWSSKGESNG